VSRPGAVVERVRTRSTLMLGIRPWLLALAILAVTGALSATALTDGAWASGPAPRARASLLDVESALMCTSCHEPLEAVSSPQALSEKAYIAKLIARGDTKHQILDEMVVQYGVEVLAKPPASGFNLTIYILPPLILAAGVAFLLLTLPKWRRRARAAAAARYPGGAPSLSATDADRINEDLARLI